MLAIHTFLRFPILVSLCLVLAASTIAQCATQWISGSGVGSGVPGWPGEVWSASPWDPDGSGPAPEQLIVCGSFTDAGGVVASNVASWDGTSWSALGAGVGGFGGGGGGASALATLPNGTIVVGGLFTTAGGVAASNIATWDGAVWSPLGGGVGLPNGEGVGALAVLPNGDLIVGGNFTTAGGVPANSIARWNGTSWSSLGTGVAGIVIALAVLPNGNLVAGGIFTAAGGTPANNIALWDGTAWAPLGAGVIGGVGGGGIRALVVLPTGDLVAGGYFTTAGGAAASRVARWDGVSWSALGLGVGSGAGILDLAALPNGDLVAGGIFATAGGAAANGIARWNGASWSPFGSGVGGSVSALAMFGSSGLVVGGLFTTAGGTAASSVALLATTCPPSAMASGNGCIGSGGQNELGATSLPWLGSVFRSNATGMSANGLVVRVHGLGASAVPLISILQQAVVGCTLLATPDVLDVYVPANGTVTSQLTIPNNLALANQTLYQQFVSLDLTSGAITSVTSTNALTVTIGAF